MQMYLKRGISNSTHLIGFTLAEVLITLGIIGVVSAMTIPTLISNYNDKVIETRKVKAKSVLANAFNGLRVETGGGNLSATDIAKCEDEDCFEGEFRKVLKIASKVDQTSEQAMMKYNFENGEKEVWNDEKHFVFTLQDGSVFGVEKTDTIKNGTFSIVSDLNGFTTPNRGSSDLCRYVVNQNASVQESCESMKEFIVKSCPEGSYLANNKCNANDVPNCKVQSQAGVCTECMDNYNLESNKCILYNSGFCGHSGGSCN